MKERPKPRKSLAYRLFYIIALALVGGGWAYAFLSYFTHYDSLHPEITWATPWVQADTIYAEGVFLWQERVIVSPRAGKVSYPLGGAPVRVGKGAVVAKISSGSAVHNVRAPVEGYFIAAFDGQENKWRYVDLWPGTHQMPKAPAVRPIANGTAVKQDTPIGKIVPQPQELRFMGYVDLTGDIEKKLASNRILVKMDALDSGSRAQVRVHDIVGHRAKVYLTMPWFPPSLLASRNYRLMIEAGETSGVAIPESAVTTRDGRMGAYVLKGSEAFFVEVHGRIIDGRKFLVTEGIRLGDAVIVDAGKAKEGRVKLW